MKVEDDEAFITRVEGLISPAEVCDLFAIQRFKKLLPASFFKKLLYTTSAQFPSIGFVIEPYSLFLFFKLKDLDLARSMLPKRYELIKTKVTEDDEPEYLHGMGILNTKGSTFWGTRLESYLIARDRETGLVSWIFVDILSNTIISQPKLGVADGNSARCMYTTNSKGEVFLDVRHDDGKRAVRLKGNITRGVKKRLDQPLWIGGNTSIAYVEELSGGYEEPFAVVFDPAEVDAALDIPLEDVELRENSLSGPVAEPGLVKVLCFPFTQHYIADSPGRRTVVRDEADMVGKYDALAKRDDLKTFSTGGIKKHIAAGMVFSVLVTVGLTVALIVALST